MDRPKQKLRMNKSSLTIHACIWLLGMFALLFTLTQVRPFNTTDLIMESIFFLACTSTFFEIMRLRLGWLMSIGWGTFTCALALDVIDEFLPERDYLTLHDVLEHFLQFGLILICVAFLQSIITKRKLIKELEREIEFRRQLEQRLKRIAHHDTLTDLYNRRAFFEKYPSLLIQYPAPVLIYIDLDNFKQLNDTQGHEAGDSYLMTFAKSLKKLLQQSGAAFRFGGDEFVVIYGGNSAENFIGLLRQSLSKLNQESGVDLSYGLLNMSESIAADQLIKEADELMYRNKQEKKHRQARAKEPRAHG
ncbi:GGDEF domain-containing protein [Motilimonas eburnea]|uniref:GGDEF domain-containing protein n=1 Tax=Motilimonas eburnea TaxID=1737488 RepID=UPI001E546886|nr:GGDEF domain-containing protein [Motilimonas eburnea]MCE2573636.1 GGDEF domain-containing protein [Motilimonas eburnea]